MAGTSTSVVVILAGALALVPRVVRAQSAASSAPPGDAQGYAVSPPPPAPPPPPADPRAPLVIQAGDGGTYRIGARTGVEHEDPSRYYGPRYTYTYEDRCQTPCTLSVRPRPFWLSVDHGFDGTIFRADVPPVGALVLVRSTPWPAVGTALIITAVAGIAVGIGMILAAPARPPITMPGVEGMGPSALEVAGGITCGASIALGLAGALVRFAAPRHWVDVAPASPDVRGPRVSLALPLGAALTF